MEEISNISVEQLSSYKDIIDFYKDFGSIFINIYNDYQEIAKGKDYYISYQDIVKRTADLCVRLNVESKPLMIALVFEYLLWGGYFSLDHRYAYNTNGRVCNVACLGADIMFGKGVCLNNAEMMTKLYQNLGYEAHTIGVSFDKSINNLDIWKPNIKRIVDNNNSFISFVSSLKIFQKIGNHAVTIVKDDIYHVYDPTSLAVLKPTDVLKVSFMGTDNAYPLKAWLMVLLEGLIEDDKHTELSDITNVLFAQGVKDVNSLLPEDTYKTVCNNMVKYLNSVESLLNDFYCKNEKDIDIITKKLCNERGKKRV